MGKLILLAILGVLGYQNQVTVAKNLQILKDAPRIIQTYMELDSFKIRLFAHASENDGHLPENIGEWLNQNFKSTGKRDAGRDYFGTPYRISLEKDTQKEVLISCGPDKECGTKDDIELKM